MSYNKIRQELISLADTQQAAILSRFFKTGPGQYGAGDKFLGIKVPKQRAIVKRYLEVSLNDIQKLLDSPVHEFRLVGVLLLVSKYEKSQSLKEQKKLFDFYLNNLGAINNWDLVDLSAPNIVGHFLFNNYYVKKPATLVLDKLNKLAKSKNLWSRRVAILATFYFIKQGRYQEIFFLTEKLKKDEHDLIHKAMGWMLREVGKKISQKRLVDYLETDGAALPRTTLRYAIERLPKARRLYFLGQKKVG